MADDIRREIPGFNQFLRDARKLGPEFNKELRKGSVSVAKYVVGKTQQNASGEQERRVAAGIQARSDRVPKIAVSSSRTYVSRSRPNARRSAAAKVKVIDTFFGVEFGGGKHGKGNPAPKKSYRDGSTKGGKHAYTTQFRPHRGRQGYFFYPTVREEGPQINKLYAKAVDDALRSLD